MASGEPDDVHCELELVNWAQAALGSHWCASRQSRTPTTERPPEPPWWPFCYVREVRIDPPWSRVITFFLAAKGKLASTPPQRGREGHEVRGEKELSAQIPISYLVDLRYASRLLDRTLIKQESQLWDVDPTVEAAASILRRMVQGYEKVYELIDSL